MSEVPTSFGAAIRAFPTIRDAAQWMGAERKNAGSMLVRDWVPEKFWGGLLEGLRKQCDIDLAPSDLEQWAEGRGRWTKTEKAPADWAALPDIERKLRRLINHKYKNPDVADDAASHAILAMMEAGTTTFAYGLVSAVNYVRRHGINGKRVAFYLSEDEAREAVELKYSTPPNHEERLFVRDVLRAAEQLPKKYRAVFNSMVKEDDDDQMAEKFGVGARSIRGYRAHVRLLLFEYMSLACGDAA